VAKKYMEKHPELKNGGQAPPVSGAPFPGGSGGGQQPPITRENLKEMSPQQIVDAQKEGRLEHLGIPKS
jgi:hypothetical protein